MIEIDTILGSKDVSPWREDMSCMSAALVFTVHKFVLANRGIVHGVMAWNIDVQLQLDNGGENL